MPRLTDMRLSVFRNSQVEPLLDLPPMMANVQQHLIVQDLLTEIAGHEYAHAAYFHTKSGDLSFNKPAVRLLSLCRPQAGNTRVS